MLKIWLWLWYGTSYTTANWCSPNLFNQPKQDLQTKLRLHCLKACDSIGSLGHVRQKQVSRLGTSNYIPPTVFVTCYYLSLPLIPVSDTQSLRLQSSMMRLCCANRDISHLWTYCDANILTASKNIIWRKCPWKYHLQDISHLWPKYLQTPKHMSVKPSDQLTIVRNIKSSRSLKSHLHWQNVPFISEAPTLTRTISYRLTNMKT